MKFIKKIAVVMVLLLSIFQISAKNKDRVFVVNKFNKDILFRTFSNGIANSGKVIKKGDSACVAAYDISTVGATDNSIWIKGFYQVIKDAKAGNVVMVSKKSNSVQVTVYKNYDDFMHANSDYVLAAGENCPTVLS